MKNLLFVITLTATASVSAFAVDIHKNDQPRTQSISHVISGSEFVASPTLCHDPSDKYYQDQTSFYPAQFLQIPGGKCKEEIVIKMHLPASYYRHRLDGQEHSILKHGELEYRGVSRVEGNKLIVDETRYWQSKPDMVYTMTYYIQGNTFVQERSNCRNLKEPQYPCDFTNHWYLH